MLIHRTLFRRLLFFPAVALLLVPALNAQPARLEQAVDAFYSPSAVAVAADGRTLYIANAARGEWGFVAGRGAVSKATLSDTGEMTVDDPRFINRINAPLGVAIFPIAVGPIPAGSIAVTVGSAWTQTPRGEKIDDARERGTGIMVFDSSSGELLGHALTGKDSQVDKFLGHPMRDPKGIAIDAAGNIYVSDTAGAATAPVAASEGIPGIMKFSAEAFVALLEDKAPPEKSVQFIHVPTSPTDVVYCPTNDSLYWVTASGYDDLGQAIFRIPNGDFSGATPIETIAKGEGPMFSVAVTPTGTILAGRGQGDVIFVRGNSRVHPVNFKVANQAFLGAGHMAVTSVNDDRIRVIIPEMASGSRGPWKQRVSVVSLPEDF